MNWMASNWWQLVCAFTLFASYVAILAKAVATIKEVETRVKTLETQVAEHKLAANLHRSADFDLRIHNIESGINTISDILIQVQIDLAVLLKQT
jgi:hypothetical protein